MYAFSDLLFDLILRDRARSRGTPVLTRACFRFENNIYYCDAGQSRLFVSVLRITSSFVAIFIHENQKGRYSSQEHLLFFHTPSAAMRYVVPLIIIAL